MREKTLSSKYELTLAIITANTHIRSEIGKMPQLYGRNSTLVKECQDFYKKRADLAKIQRRKQERFDQAFKLQSYTVHRAALSAELEAINELSEHGNIPLSVENMLKEEVEKRIEILD